MLNTRCTTMLARDCDIRVTPLQGLVICWDGLPGPSGRPITWRAFGPDRLDGKSMAHWAIVKRVAGLGGGIFRAKNSKAANGKECFPLVFFASFARPKKIFSTYTIAEGLKARPMIAQAEGLGIRRQ